MNLVFTFDNAVPGVRTLRRRTPCIWDRPSWKPILTGQVNVAVKLLVYSASALFVSRLGYRLPWSMLFGGSSQILQENTGILSWSRHERFPQTFYRTWFIDCLTPDNSLIRKCVQRWSNVPFSDRCVKNCIIYIKRYLTGKRRSSCSMLYL